MLTPHLPMTLRDLQTSLLQRPEALVRFVLPDGGLIPVHAHVTEVGRVDKRFIDCGGTRRNDSHCLLQTWVADDVHHRLNAATLAGIIGKGLEVVEDDSLPVQVEYEEGLVSQFPIASVSEDEDALYIHTGLRHTDCLAKELCTPATGCCGSNDCCN